MAKIPKQRGSGQFGGSGGHRANRGAFRASGGNVKPPSKGCLWIVVVAVGGLTGAAHVVSQIL